jgi:phospholipid/cholesterol/gamma-HCH transport system substrate-binding protein
MEFNARYILMALFTLAVILCGFGFVYWLNHSGGFGERANYKVRFSIPVSGIANGSNVLFNGLKVGEVTALDLDSENPRDFSATISIAADTPVREDTVVGVDYQGLTGAANILLTGGTKNAALLSAKEGQLPQLIADPAHSRSWTENAGRVLSRLDTMLAGDNNRLDNILAGLERMTGGPDGKGIVLYDLPIPPSVETKPTKTNWRLVVAEPSVLLSLNTDKIQQLSSELSWVSLGDARWTDNLPNLVQTKLIQAFENVGYEGALLRPADAFDAPFKLAMDIRTFHYKAYGEPAGLIDIMAKLIDRDGLVIAVKRFKKDDPISSNSEAEIANAMGASFLQLAQELVFWSAGKLDAESNEN